MTPLRCRRLLMMALIGTGYALQSALRLRSEETGLRAEPVLAAPIPRRQWVASHLAIALAGSLIVLAAAGLGAGLAYGVAAGDPGQAPRLLGAALAYTPALWLLVGLATALFGLLPRGVTTAWAALAACFVIGLLGEILDLPGWPPTSHRSSTLDNCPQPTRPSPHWQAWQPPPPP